MDPKAGVGGEEGHAWHIRCGDGEQQNPQTSGVNLTRIEQDPSGKSKHNFYRGTKKEDRNI